MALPRIAITGMGAISAAGIGVDALWSAARDGVSQISPMNLPRGETLRVRIGGQVRNFDPGAYLSEAVLRRCDRFTQLAHVAVEEAIRQAGLDDGQMAGPRTAVIMGTGIGGMNTIDDGLSEFYAGTGKLIMLAVPRLMPSSAASHVSIMHGVTGPCFCVTSACSSATQSIGVAAQLIKAGIVDRAIAGGTEACLTPATVRAWELLRVLSPDTCRPFSADRNGMILGEGAGAVVIESEAAMEARGASPIAWLAGYGTSSDAKDIVQPDVGGASASMSAALEDAGLGATDIDYINAHGTGTVLNDVNEAEAIGRVFGEHGATVPVSSTKPVIGHTLGASGALELMVTIKAVTESTIPPHINVTNVDPKCRLNLPRTASHAPVRAALSNSFAFGGINASLIVTAAA
jgi:nodulation protein E